MKKTTNYHLLDKNAHKIVTFNAKLKYIMRIIKNQITVYVNIYKQYTSQILMKFGILTYFLKPKFLRYNLVKIETEVFFLKQIAYKFFLLI